MIVWLAYQAITAALTMFVGSLVTEATGTALG